jgi:YidC/Oxa1 family membrane protein insertase
VERRRIARTWLGLSLVVALISVGTAGRGITHSIVTQEGIDEIEVTTSLASYIFSEDGGVMKSLFLTFAPYGSTAIELLPATKTDAKTLSRQFVEGAEFPFALEGEGFAEGLYDLQDPTYSETGALVIEFVGQFEQASVTKRYTIREDDIYVIDFELTVENRSDDAVDLTMILGAYIPQERSPTLYYMFDDEPGTELLASGSYFTFGGVGLMDKSIVFFLNPDDGTAAHPLMTRTEAGTQRFGVTMTASPGNTAFHYSLYGGRRRYLLMEGAGLASLDDPGAGARLMIPVIRFLSMLFRSTGNYGWAIILFTILTRIVLFPLMRKQYHSMAKMQKLQPKMKRIQERFKDDRQLLNQKTMELYRKEGVNPMGGCLPLLIQLPILILIWRAILHSAELIHLSPGFLWVPDLSMHDPYFILVVATTAIMLVQQWVMTPRTGETTGGQKYLGYIFPLFMAVLLWRFPAGLWLYYLLTTAAQVGQQAIVNWEMSRAEAMAPAIAEADSSDLDAGGDNGGADADG